MIMHYNFVNDVRKINKIALFLSLCIVSVLINYLGNSTIITEDLYFSYFSEQFSFDTIDEFVKLKKKWEWISYALLPLMFFLKISTVAVCISAGLLLYNHQVQFKKIFHLVLIAEFIFIIPALIKIFWFVLIQQHYTLDEIQAFYPLSLLSFIDHKKIDQWLIYPLQTINFFELVYCLMISYGLSILIKKAYPDTLKIVAYSYGSALILWLITVSFLSLTFIE